MIKRKWFNVHRRVNRLIGIAIVTHSEQYFRVKAAEVFFKEYRRNVLVPMKTKQDGSKCGTADSQQKVQNRESLSVLCLLACYVW